MNPTPPDLLISTLLAIAASLVCLLLVVFGAVH